MKIKCPCCSSSNITQLGDTVESDVHYLGFNDDVQTKKRHPIQLCLDCECKFAIIKESNQNKKVLDFK